MASIYRTLLREIEATLPGAAPAHQPDAAAQALAGLEGPGAGTHVERASRHRRRLGRTRLRRRRHAARPRRHGVRSGAHMAGGRARRSTARWRRWPRQRPAHPDRRLRRDAEADARGRRAPATRLLRMPLNAALRRRRRPRLPRLPAPLDAAGRHPHRARLDWRDKSTLLRAAMAGSLGGFRCAAGTPCRTLRRPHAARDAGTDRAAVRVGAQHAGRSIQRRGVPARAARRAVRRAAAAPTCCCRASTWAAVPDAALAWLRSTAPRCASARVQALAPKRAMARRRRALRPRGAGLPAVGSRAAGARVRHRRGMLVRRPPKPCASRPSPRSTCTVAPRSRPDARAAQPPRDRAGAVRVRSRQLGGPEGVLAFVVSASETPRETGASSDRAGRQPIGTGLAAARCRPWWRSAPPSLARRARTAAREHRSGLLACGDYTEGPYPATLEGAILSGLAAAKALKTP
jgi:hypothetical protein